MASSIAVSWLALEVQRARRQAETVQRLRHSGRRVDYDWQVDADDPSMNPLPIAVLPGSTWLRNCLGVDFFSAVVRVGFDNEITTVPDADLEALDGLNQLGVTRVPLTLACWSITT